MSKKKLNNPKCNRSEGNRSEGNRSKGNRSKGNRSKGNRSKGNRSKGNRSKGNRSRKIKVRNYTKKRCKKHNSQKGGVLGTVFETKFKQLIQDGNIVEAINLGNKEYMERPENSKEISNLMTSHYERLAQRLHSGADLEVYNATAAALRKNTVTTVADATKEAANIASYQTNKILGTLNSLKDTSLLDVDMMRVKTIQDGITNLRDIIGLQEGENGINKLRNIIGLQEGENVMNMLGISADENAMNKLEQISSTVSNNLVAKISSGILAGCLPEVEDGINKKVNDLANAYSITPLKETTVAAELVTDRARIIHEIHTKQNDHIQEVTIIKTDRDRRKRSRAAHNEKAAREKAAASRAAHNEKAAASQVPK